MDPDSMPTQVSRVDALRAESGIRKVGSTVTIHSSGAQISPMPLTSPMILAFLAGKWPRFSKMDENLVQNAMLQVQVWSNHTFETAVALRTESGTLSRTEEQKCSFLIPPRGCPYQGHDTYQGRHAGKSGTQIKVMAGENQRDLGGTLRGHANRDILL
ncbi:hypothetical protein Y1Q_0008947 [Alligator mississippiensis]|uniref:Uncharacterized protein n=1 Tax=Alligator mississippiensis TaxID=8496 RepID=A0A151NKC9_ALLMI|nr:hypothetical protein Y1Q_0008947 [Alligator mississippiensis]